MLVYFKRAIVAAGVAAWRTTAATTGKVSPSKAITIASRLFVWTPQNIVANYNITVASG